MPKSKKSYLKRSFEYCMNDPITSIIFRLISKANEYDMEIRRSHLLYYLVEDYPDTITSETMKKDMENFWGEFFQMITMAYHDPDVPIDDSEIEYVEWFVPLRLHHYLEFVPEEYAKDSNQLTYKIKILKKSGFIESRRSDYGKPHYRISEEGLYQMHKRIILQRLNEYTEIIDNFDNDQIEKLYFKLPELTGKMDETINSIKGMPNPFHS